jgi:hypothetical protein
VRGRYAANVHGFQTRLDAERPIGAESVLHPRIFDDDIVVRQIAGEIERARP